MKKERLEVVLFNAITYMLEHEETRESINKYLGLDDDESLEVLSKEEEEEF